MIEDVACNAGWLVLPLDASTPNITERLEERIEWVRDEDESLASAPRGGTEATTKGVRVLGAEWQRQVVRAIEPKWGIRRQLTTLAEHAAANGSAVLLTIDELHSGNLEELRRLSSDVQHITKREQRPLAFVGAGLAGMRHMLLEDKKMTLSRRSSRRGYGSHRSSSVSVISVQTGRAHAGGTARRASTCCRECAGRRGWVPRSRRP